MLKIKFGTTLKTNVSVTLRSVRAPDNPIQSGMLKFKVTDTTVFGNIWRPNKGSSFDVIGMRAAWTFLALFNRFGLYSGRVMDETSEFEFLVKVKPIHSVKFDAVPYFVINPDQIISIPVTVQNLGNYNDSFSFRVASEHDDIKITTPVSITLAPGEIKDTYLGVTIPPSAFDYGTIHQVKLEAYSIDQPNITIAARTVTFESKGVYFSELSGIGIIMLIFILLLIVLFFISRRRKFMEKICVKPDKPWELPEEKKYLEKLKKQDKQRYDEVLKMMDDEYRSALLWYEYYIKSVLQPKPIKKKKIKKVKKEKPREKEKLFKFLFRKEEKPVKKEKPEKKENLLKVLFKKLEKPFKKKEVEIEPIKPSVEKERRELVIDKKAEVEKLKKERALLRIRREQERQKRKLSKFSS